MKHFWIIILFGIGFLSFTGCYTQLAVNNNDYSEVYEEPVIVEIPGPIIIIEPAPQPIIIIPPTNPPHPKPRPPKYKERILEHRQSYDGQKRDPIRNTSGRNNSGGRGGRR